MRLKDKVAIVTGSGRGIGKAIALAFAKEGAKVIIADINRENAQRVTSEIGLERVFAIKVDVSNSQDVKKLFSETLRKFGKLDILVNNAGIVRPDLVVNIKEENWDRVIDVDLKGCFLCSQAAARTMIKQKNGGRIINISSINAQRAEPYYGASDAAKGGIESLARIIASELGPHGITVNTVSPGSVFTEINKDVHSEERIRVKKKVIPLGEIAQPEDIVPAVIFFASDEAWYITGQVLHVDGGSFVNAGRQINWA